MTLCKQTVQVQYDMTGKTERNAETVENGGCPYLAQHRYVGYGSKLGDSTVGRSFICIYFWEMSQKDDAIVVL